MKLAIIIPIYNQYMFTEECIKDLSYLNENHEIIIIDNGSTDGSYDRVITLINKLKPEWSWKVLKNAENEGFSRANNRGYAHKSNNIDGVLFLNNDIRVNPKHIGNWTDVIFECISKDNTLFSPTAGLIDDNYQFVYETKKSTDKYNYLSGWCLFGNVSVWEKIKEDNKPENGPWWEIPGLLAYFEDTYMGFQTKHLGIKSEIVNVPLIHLGRRTGRTMNLSGMYNAARSKFIEKFKARGFKL